MTTIDLLIAGLGWTGEYVLRECESQSIKVAYTTTSGRDNSIAFRFDPESDDPEPFRTLPSTSTLLITFPLLGALAAKRFITLYKETHPDTAQPNYIILGTTSYVQPVPGSGSPWCDENVAIDPKEPRVAAEIVVMEAGGCALSLSGLFDYKRRYPGNFFCQQRPPVHFIHGEDVARAIIALHSNFSAKKRWIYDCPFETLSTSQSAITDVAITDDLDDDEIKRRERCQWVLELMVEQGVRGLPREAGPLGRAIDSRAFWDYANITPIHTKL
ncbi:hypothetical protein BC829DRAFT_405266 [Chytridium lagenaria]|nr:hypothetical protein BC829DRAFT_405266 [Chytridium lagenaria]